MGHFDQFANQGGAAAWDPSERDEAKRLAEEQLNNADLSGEFPEPLGGEPSMTGENDAEPYTADESPDSSEDDSDPAEDNTDAADDTDADAAN